MRTESGIGVLPNSILLGFGNIPASGVHVKSNFPNDFDTNRYCITIYYQLAVVLVVYLIFYKTSTTLYEVIDTVRLVSCKHPQAITSIFIPKS
jgi:hypothetical protein